MSTWILLRGLTREKRHWNIFPDQLKEACPGDCVITLELPGNGELNTLDSPTTIDGMVSHCQGEAARLGLTPPYRLLALSMGAMVATAWAQARPDQVEACVLINTSFGTFSPLHHRMRPQVWLSLLRFLITPSEVGKEQIIFTLTSRLSAPSIAVIEDWAAIRRSRPVKIGNALRQTLAAARFAAPLMASVPTLVLTSAGDQLVDSRCSLEIARRWSCAIATHPTAGHDLPLDDGPWVTREVRRWAKDQLG